MMRQASVGRASQRFVATCALVFSGLACNSFLDSAPNSNPAASVFLPTEYDADPARRWPLIISLHGAGGLNPADNLIDVKARSTPGFPFIVIAPVSRGEWDLAALSRLLSAAVGSYRVDPSRVYVTGISMGARAAWNLARLYPADFAAVVLIAGDPDPAYACALRDVPVWLFHNREDPIVPVIYSQQLYDARQACGGDTKLTIYETVPAGTWTHNAWQAAWTTPELYDWLLSKER